MDKEQMIKVMSYLIGYRVGSQVMPQMLPGLQGDDVLAEMLGKGFQDGLSGNMDMSLIDEHVNEYQQTFLSMLQKRGDEKAQKNLAVIEGKLSNENFTARAPENVVNAEREKAEKARSLISQLNQSREALAKL